MTDNIKESKSQANKRIAKNTLILYVRMFIMTIIGLYTSRVVLQVLGVEDYGIYNAVGGFVAMFSLLSGTLTNSINRFLTFELGKGNSPKLKRVFATSLNVMMMLSALILIVGATIGLWFLNSQMNIPDGRMEAANVVLACSVATFITNLLSVPYNAAIVAHEKMSAFAYISLVEITAKLLIVYALYIIPADKLAAYAILLFILQLLVRLLYGIYCKRHFEECVYHFVFDKPLLKQMTSFAGWNFLAGSAGLINNYGVNVMMNIFFGVVVNAARGIATNVNSHVHMFVTNFMMAVNPQITKSYAQGDFNFMHSLICRGAKFSYFLMLIFLIPICLETNQLLRLWLGIVPDYAVIFVQLTLAMTTLNTLSGSLITGLHATGNIKKYMIIVGSVEILNFPVTYLAFRLGSSPQTAYYIYLTFYFILMLLRLYLIKDLIHMKASTYIKSVYLKALQVSIIAAIIPVTLRLLMTQETISRFIIICIVSIASTLATICYVGLDKEERALALKIINQKILHKAG